MALAQKQQLKIPQVSKQLKTVRAHMIQRPNTFRKTGRAAKQMDDLILHAVLNVS